MRKLRSLIATVAVLGSVSPLAAQPVLLFGHSGIPNGIPNPCASPTISSVQSGRWDQRSTWSGNRVPEGGDRVMIAAGTSVEYTTLSDVKPTCVNIDGALRFSATTSTRLRVGTLIVLEDGTLEIGTPSQPVAAGVTAELYLAGLPFDPADPEQFWGGLIGIGRVTMHGAPLSQTFARLTAEPTAGQNSVTLATAVPGWQVGDEIVIPDTRSLTDNERFAALTLQDERARITAINGQTLTLNRAWSYTHPGARDAGGTVRLYPHVGNVSRNVKVLSDNPGGVRGHTMYTHRAQIDIRYVELRDLGRTTNANLAPTTNQLGRYPMHIHHLMGPVNPANSGYQFQLVGNAVVDGRKWPLTVHNSHYGLIRDNVVAFGLGAGYVTEDGNESQNEFTRNFGMAITGDVNPREQDGRAGSIFWFNGFNHILTDNVAASGHNHNSGIVSGAGFDFSQPAAAKAARIPLYRGADLMQSGAYQLVNMQAVPIPRFERNEAYGAMAVGMVIWNLGTDGYNYVQNMGETVIRNYTSWNCYEGAFFGYPIHHVTLDGFTWYGTAIRSRAWSTGDYKARDIRIRNFTIVGGEAMGIDVSTGSEGTFRIEEGTIQSAGGSDANIYIPRMATFGTGATVRPRSVEIRNVRFQPWPGRTVTNLRKEWGGGNQPPSTLDEAFVYGYNGDSSDNFQWYYTQQGTQNIAGGQAPCTTTRAGIVGIVCPIGAVPPAPPPPTAAPAPAPPPSSPPPPTLVPPLTVTCPANQSVTSPNGMPLAVTYPAPQVTGGTPPITVLASLASGATVPIGTTSVTVTAQDSNGQKATCSFTVTVTAPQPGGTITVTSTAQLQSAIDGLTSGITIVIGPGTYRLDRTLRIRNGVTDVTVKGSTGNRGDVTILGTGMNATGVNVGFQIENAQDVVISDLSVGEFAWNSILLQGQSGADRVRIRNVRLFDAGQQFIKSTISENVPNGVDDVLVERSLLEYTSIGPSNGAIEGIQVNFGTRWTIRQNVFRNIHVPAGAPNTQRPAILMSTGSKDTEVSRNTFIDCERAVAFGLGPQTGYSHSHSGGTIVNNFIYRTQAVNADASILVWDSPGTEVLHNTVMQNGTFATAIDYRYSGSTGISIMNNLTDGSIDRRNGAQGTTAGNFTEATPGMFLNASAVDLHIRETDTALVDCGVVVNSVTEDWDGQARPVGPAPDIGADELGIRIGADQPGR